MSEQKKQGLSQLASMLEVYLQQEVPDLEVPALPPSCREPLNLIAKVRLMDTVSSKDVGSMQISDIL